MSFSKIRLIKPILNSNFIKREGITSVLNRNKSKALTLVVAGAGYGKSIAISQWLDQFDEKYCWVSMGDDCNNYKTFVEYIIRAIRSEFPGSLGESLKMINSMEVDSSRVISESLINELFDVREDVFVVLDDYHLIHNEENHQLLEMILEFLSSKIHLVVISRNDPMLNVSHLVAYDNICEIRGKDLRFNAAEIAELAEQVYHCSLTGEQVSSVLYITEGWIIAVRLHVKILSEGGNLSENIAELQNKQKNLMEHMFHEVITVEQDDIYKGILLASFSERFTTDLIIHLMEFDTTNNLFDADLFRARFEDTLSKSMFIYALDHEQEWFRFHRLVHDLLNNKVRQRYSGKQIKNFYIEASRYFEGIHSYEEALQTALYGDDVDFAISVILANYNALLDTEQFQRLGSWLNMLPPGTIETHPELLMIRAALHEAKNDLHGLSSDLGILQKIIVAVDKNTREGKQIWGSYYALSAGNYFFSREYNKVLEMADKAIPLLKDNISYLHSFVIIISSMTMQVVGRGNEATELTDQYLAKIPQENKIGLLRTHLCQLMVKSIQGEINKITVSANLAIELSLDQNKWMTYAMANYYLAASNYFRNKQEEVISIYKESRKNGFAGRPNFILQTGFFAALKMHANENSSGFKQILAELHDYVDKFHSSELRNLIVAFELEHELLHGELEKARELAGRVDFSDYPKIYYFFVPSLTKIKLMLADTQHWDTEETRTELEELIKRKEKMHLNHIVVQAYPLLALWHFRYGKRSDALTYLRKAISLAETGEFVRVFLDLGDEMQSLMEALDPEEKRKPFVDRIMNGFHFKYSSVSEKPTPQKSREVLLDSPVTAREQEILELIVKGHSNKEIAGLLYLSLGTIKTYIYNIYQKLEVKNRVEAVMKCKELGLLSVSEDVHANG